MHKIKSSCNYCGSNTVMLEDKINVSCTICGSEFVAQSTCTEGHYICSNCNGKFLKDNIKKYCTNTEETNPLLIAEAIMKLDNIPMHGPIHHLIYPAALLTAHANRTDRTQLENWLEEADRRSSHIPGATCGHWGACGAGLGVGITFSIINGVSPLSGEEWKDTGLLTSDIIRDIAIEGGPRCCKRDGYIALSGAMEYLFKDGEVPEIVCDFYGNNKTCKRLDCKFFPVKK